MKKYFDVFDLEDIFMILAFLVVLGALLAVIAYSVYLNGGGLKEFVGSVAFYMGFMWAFHKVVFR